MGKRGPTPQPTEILKAKGSWRGDIQKNPPKKLSLKNTAPPVYLTPRQCEKWAEMVALTTKTRVLTPADFDVLARYCVAFDHWQTAVDFIEKNGQTYEAVTNNGFTFKKHPQVDIASDLSKQLLKMAEHFGLTPSARTRIEIQPEEPKGPAKKSPLKLTPPGVS